MEDLLTPPAPLLLREAMLPRRGVTLPLRAMLDLLESGIFFFVLEDA